MVRAFVFVFVDAAASHVSRVTSSGVRSREASEGHRWLGLTGFSNKARKSGRAEVLTVVSRLDGVT